MAARYSTFASFADLGPVIIKVKPAYGYVILTGVASGCLLTWQMTQVGKMRKKCGINYPTMYSPDTTGDGRLFNCYQRAHQNTLEGYPLFLMLLFTGGFEHPIPSALAGVLWIIGRVVYSLEYYTGDPKKRSLGVLGNLAFLTLTGSSVALAVRLLKWV
uniref:Glutathione S-transferase 3, mitochondrial n=1 Tax=Daphnia galeata TaxID=27404 RepID=A0A8J2W940_9CRUS|nr:unnamed protein product [Daphnia galeata]